MILKPRLVDEACVKAQHVENIGLKKGKSMLFYVAWTCVLVSYCVYEAKQHIGLIFSNTQKTFLRKSTLIRIN